MLKSIHHPTIWNEIKAKAFKQHQTLGRHDICHKHQKQRLCKIISTRVKFHFVSVLLVQFVYVSYSFCGNVVQNWDIIQI